jgi:hypothetical protein
MDRSQQYVTLLLDKIPASGLSDAGHQESFGRIKEDLAQTQDLRVQLKSLYKVANFSAFALGLMWIADKVERDPSKLESTNEEENFVLELLRKAFGEVSAVPEAAAPSLVEDPFGLNLARGSGAAQSELAEPPPAAETAIQPPVAAEPEAGLAAGTVSEGGAGGDEQGFATTLEKLVEAIQSGAEDRGPLLEELTTQAERVVASPGFGDDFKAFCGYMIEFLKYISANQLFDDIRVMNMMSNVFDPFSQWTKAEPAARAGMLDQPNEVLRDFKTLFE